MCREGGHTHTHALAVDEDMHCETSTCWQVGCCADYMSMAQPRCDDVVAPGCTDAGPTFDEPTWMVAPQYYHTTVDPARYNTARFVASVINEWVTTLKYVLDGIVSFVLGWLGRLGRSSACLVDIFDSKSKSRTGESLARVWRHKLHIAYRMGPGLDSFPICRVDRLYTPWCSLPGLCAGVKGMG